MQNPLYLLTHWIFTTASEASVISSPQSRVGSQQVQLGTGRIEVLWSSVMIIPSLPTKGKHRTSHRSIDTRVHEGKQERGENGQAEPKHN